LKLTSVRNTDFTAAYLSDNPPAIVIQHTQSKLPQAAAALNHDTAWPAYTA